MDKTYNLPTRKANSEWFICLTCTAIHQWKCPNGHDNNSEPYNEKWQAVQAVYKLVIGE